MSFGWLSQASSVIVQCKMIAHPIGGRTNVPIDLLVHHKAFTNIMVVMAVFMFNCYWSVCMCWWLI